ncbi:hypothetical protein ACFLQ2_02125 [archaeon]
MAELVHTVMLHEPKGELSAHVERVSRGGKLFYTVQGMKGKRVFYHLMPKVVEPHLGKFKLLPDPEPTEGPEEARHAWIKLPGEEGYKIKKNEDGTNKVVVEITQEDYAKIINSNKVYDVNRLVAKFLWRKREFWEKHGIEKLPSDVKNSIQNIAERLLFVFDYPRSNRYREEGAEVVRTVAKHVDLMDPPQRKMLADLLNHDKRFKAIRQKHRMREFTLDDIEKLLEKKDKPKSERQSPAQTESPHVKLAGDIKSFFKRQEQGVRSGNHETLLSIVLKLHKERSGKSSKEVFWRGKDVIVPILARKRVEKSVAQMKDEDVPTFVDFLNNDETMKLLRDEHNVPEFTNEEISRMKRIWAERRKK